MREDRRVSYHRQAGRQHNSYQHAILADGGLPPDGLLVVVEVEHGAFLVVGSKGRSTPSYGR